jgi:hypothetical protein
MTIMAIWVGALPSQLSLTSRIVLMGIRKRLVLFAILSVSLIGPRARAEAGDSSQDSGALLSTLILFPTSGGDVWFRARHPVAAGELPP